ncbi:MAG: hypothetical protein HFE79_13935 [Ruminiclostridium sp.]|jgi:hypothetical protein|nr:hypothetical protein [Ruminiclostridium sp.]
MAESFTDLSTNTNYSTIRDEHEVVKITEKNVKVGDIGKIVTGEVNSQEIEFSIPRYYDNVDLLNKKFQILYQTKGGVFKADAINIAYNDREIRFNWLMNEDATMYPGKITAVVQIEGEDEQGNDYVFKTMNFSVNIEDALNEYGTEGVYKTWATDIESRIENLEKNNSPSTASEAFIGTMEEYNTAYSSGDIPNGMFVTITDI